MDELLVSMDVMMECNLCWYFEGIVEIGVILILVIYWDVLFEIVDCLFFFEGG